MENFIFCAALFASLRIMQYRSNGLHERWLQDLKNTFRTDFFNGHNENSIAMAF